MTFSVESFKIKVVKKYSLYSAALLKPKNGKVGKNMKFKVIIRVGELSGFVVECPSLPGCISQVKTRKETLENIEDAIKGYLESLKKHNEPIPPPIEEDFVEVAI